MIVPIASDARIPDRGRVDSAEDVAPCFDPSGRRCEAGTCTLDLIVAGLLACRRAVPPACARAPRPSFPSRAKGAWMELHQSFLEAGQAGERRPALPRRLDHAGLERQQKTWKRFYGPRNAANFGIGGDRTQHVLWRIQNGELDGIEPKVVVLMIGTNNASGNTPDEIAQGITAIVEELRSRLPKTKVLLLGVFPRSEKPDADPRASSKSVNEKIARLDDGSNVKYLDIGKAFLNEDGTISQRDHARLSSPEQQGLPDLGRRHGADALVDARRAEVRSGSRDGSRPNRSDGLSLGSSPHIACSSRMGWAGCLAPRLFEQRQDGGGELQVDLRGDLDVERRARDDRAAMPHRLDELAVVGDLARDSASAGHTPCTAGSRRNTCGVWAR